MSGPGSDSAAARSDAALVAPLGPRGLTFLHALTHADDAKKIALWLEVGEALVAAGRWERARPAWARGLELAEASPATRSQAASFYWRLGQLGEGTGALEEAVAWYDRAAVIFRKEQALADEAVARMAMARVTYHLSGAGEALQHARDAVLAAREADAEGGGGLLGETLEMAGEIVADLGQTEEAIACFRDALRHHERVRIETGGPGGSTRSSDEVRAAVALAEALLEGGQVVAAVTTYESVEPLIASHDSLETRGRGMAINALLNLELGRVAEAVEPLKQAHEWLDMAGMPLRRARLFVATGQRIQRHAGNEQARPHFEKAWVLARATGDKLRIAPIGYALARCYVMLDELILADDVIIEALAHVQNVGDVEGTAHCADLGVRIAVKLAQGKLALDRLLLLARARGRLGDKLAEVRTFRNALEASIAVPGMDPTPIAEELMDALRNAGTGVLGPTTVMEIAAQLAGGKFQAYAAEIATNEADRHLAEGRRSEAARTWAKAAVWALQSGDRRGAAELWDRAANLGDEIGLPEAEQWAIERAIAAEG